MFLSVMLVGTTAGTSFVGPWVLLGLLVDTAGHGVIYRVAVLKGIGLRMCHRVDGMCPKRDSW